MSADLFDLIRRAAHDHDAENDALHNLMTWLPSYKAAQIHFGDYAMEQTFHRESIVKEATKVLSILSGYACSIPEAIEWLYVSDEAMLDVGAVIPSKEEKLQFIWNYFNEQFSISLVVDETKGEIRR